MKTLLRRSRPEPVAFGDDGKLWHLGAAMIVGALMWVIIIDTAFAWWRIITG
jgi:alkylated DNA nucleotide flippase Atl1